MTDLALAAMEADIEAIAKLETWRAKMQLDHDSKEYLKMKKALLKSSSARLTKGQGARSKAKAKKEKLQWPTKSESARRRSKRMTGTKQWRRSRNEYMGTGHPITRAQTHLRRRATLLAASL